MNYWILVLRAIALIALVGLTGLTVKDIIAYSMKRAYSKAIYYGVLEIIILLLFALVAFGMK